MSPSDVSSSTAIATALKKKHTFLVPFPAFSRFTGGGVRAKDSKLELHEADFDIIF